MARITVQPGSYREATVILMQDGVAVGEIVALAVYERQGELCVTLGLGLPDGLQAARLDTAPLPEEWDGWIAEREADYAAQYLPFTFTASQRSPQGGNPSGASSGRWPKPGKGGQSNQSSARWRKPDAKGRPNHGGRRW